MENSKLVSDTITISECIVIVFAISLNSVGIYLLCQIRNTRTNQNVILMNLSSAEILLCLIKMIDKLFSLLRISYDMKIIKTVQLCFYLTYYLLMILMTLDRLFVSVSPIKYQVIMTQRKTKMVLTSSWIAGLIFGLLVYSLRPLDILYLFATVLMPVLNGSFFVAALTTYSYILHKLLDRRTLINKNSRENSSNNPTKNSRQHKELAKFYYVAGLILLTYIILVGIPSSVKLFVYYPDMNSFGYRMLTAPYYVNCIADPCIYIFLQPTVRKLLKNKITMYTRAGVQRV